MSRPSLSVEFPSGIPILSGVYGIANHHPGTHPIPLIHSDWDLIFFEEGHGGLRLKDDKPLDIPRDHFLLLPPFVSIWFRPPTALLRLWFCHFSFIPIPRNVFPSVRSDSMEHSQHIHIPLIFSKQEAPDVWLAYRDMLATELSSDGPKWRMAHAIIRLVSALAAFALESGNSKRSEFFVDPSAGLDPRVEETCRKIIDEPGFPWRVAGLATSVGLSTGHLNKLFQNGLGISAKRYVIQTRFRFALKLLDNSWERNTSIKEVSAACGFSSQELFAHQFKKFFGITPLEYRQHLERERCKAINKSLHHY